ncbi:MAG: lipid-binding SYLF domain-containing protein, partial [Gammaproteobacteria bacterium]
IYKGKVTLGGDASVAAGPVGRMTSASTDAAMKAEIYSYSRNRGFFAGISVEGGVLAMDKRANSSFYKSSASPREILSDPHMPTPLQARRFQSILDNTAPRLASRQKGSQTAHGDSSTPYSSTENSGVRTYGVQEAPVTSGSSIY